MKYKRIDENTLTIYISEQDIHDKYLNIDQLFTADQTSARDFITNLLKQVDPSGDFVDSGQLSIQMMPKNKGLVINIQKLGIDDEASEAEILKAISEQNIQVIDDMKALMQVVDDMVEEQKQEDEEQAKNRIAYILGKTATFEDIIQLAHLGINWYTASQKIYYSERSKLYYVLFKYPKGLADELVTRDFMCVAEWLDFEIKSFDEVLADAKLIMEDTEQATVMEQLNKAFN